jgi:hypothetical protein
MSQQNPPPQVWIMIATVIIIVVVLIALNTSISLLVAGAVFGLVGSIGVTIFTEKLRSPDLSLSIAQPATQPYQPPAPVTSMTSLHVNLHNAHLPPCAGWLVRAPALQCRGQVWFYYLNGQAVFEDVMPGRWASFPERILNPIFDKHGHFVARMRDEAWFSRESRVDVYPGECEGLDIAMRADDDAECYGWNDDSYRYDWRNPNRRLDPGCYLVKVVITSSGQRCEGFFHLKNDGSRAEFQLTPASTSQETLMRDRLTTAQGETA